MFDFFNNIWLYFQNLNSIWFLNIFFSSLMGILNSNFFYTIVILIIAFFIIYTIRNLFIKYWNIFFKLFKKITLYFYKKIWNLKIVKEFIQKNPQKSKFIKNRVIHNNFLWWPLTILLFLIIYVLIEYIWLTDDILDKKLITQIDVRLSEFFYYFKDSRLINFFLFISYFWISKIVVLITLITSIILFIRWKIFEIIWLFISVLITIIVAWLSKILIERPRPNLAVYQEISYSFPSFHSAIWVALYWFIFWLVLFNFKKWKTKINIIFIWVSFAFLIWFSRLYLNVHYLSDIIAWWFLWFLWLMLWITIIWYLKHI